MIRSVPAFVALLVLAATIQPPPARPTPRRKVTAGEVVDAETLKEFVLWAESVFAAVDDINEGAKLIQEVRTEGSDYNAGNIYVILFTTEGQVFIHGEDPNIDGRNAFNVKDDEGKLVVQEMLDTGADDGGGFVEWCWDDPADDDDVFCKDSYGIQYHSKIAEVDFLLVGGYYQDLTHAGEPLPDIPLPEVSAVDVVDRETLKQFVQGSLDWVVELLGLVGFARANEWKAVLREDGGHFRSGPIYLFIFTPEAYVLFGSLLAGVGSAARSGNGGQASPSAHLPISANAILDGTSFQVSPGVSDDGTGYSLWGCGELMRFSNRKGEGFGDGEVMTAALGGDYVLGSVVAGLALTHSRGSGRFELGRPGDDDFGDVTTSLTSGFPYARLSIGDRLLTWGVLESGRLRLPGREPPATGPRGGGGLRGRTHHRLP